MRKGARIGAHQTAFLTKHLRPVYKRLTWRPDRSFWRLDKTGFSSHSRQNCLPAAQRFSPNVFRKIPSDIDLLWQELAGGGVLLVSSLVYLRMRSKRAIA